MPRPRTFILGTIVTVVALFFLGQSSVVQYGFAFLLGIAAVIALAAGTGYVGYRLIVAGRPEPGKSMRDYNFAEVKDEINDELEDVFTDRIIMDAGNVMADYAEYVDPNTHEVEDIVWVIVGLLDKKNAPAMVFYSTSEEKMSTYVSQPSASEITNPWDVYSKKQTDTDPNLRRRQDEVDYEQVNGDGTTINLGPVPQGKRRDQSGDDSDDQWGATTTDTE